MDMLSQLDFAFELGAITWSDLLTAMAVPAMVTVVAAAIAIGLALGKDLIAGREL